jgi:hypothetical protein
MNRSFVYAAAILTLAACGDGVSPTEPRVALAPALAKSSAARPTTTNERVPVSGVLMSPCTGESMVFEGTMHVVTTTQTDAGGTHTRIHSNFADVKGIAIGSGRLYVIQSNSKESATVQTNGSGTFETSEYFRVISQGPLDNWHTRVMTRGTIDANGNRVVTNNDGESECRG